MNVCQICGVPSDAGYFDDAHIIQTSKLILRKNEELAKFELHPQYCGVLLYFTQYAKRDDGTLELAETPHYEWVILCNSQPRAPYLATTIVRNPWGQNAFPIHLRLEEGCVLSFVVRRIGNALPGEADHTEIGGRLQGRYWYNTAFGGASSSLCTAQHR